MLKRGKRGKIFYTKLLMKIATYSVVLAEVVSIFTVETDLPIGILILFFNWILLFFSVFAAVMLHLQILQEEKYLPAAFGEEYISDYLRTHTDDRKKYSELKKALAFYKLENTQGEQE